MQIIHDCITQRLKTIHILMYFILLANIILQIWDHTE